MGFFGSIQGAIAKGRSMARTRMEETPEQKIKRVEQERIRLQKKADYEDKLRQEKAEVRKLKTRKVRRLAERVGTGLKKAKSGGARLKSSLGSTSGSRNVFGGASRDVFGGGRNVFYDEPKKKKESKTVVIKIQ